MGTSSSYGGPVGTGSLLPPGAPPPPEDPEAGAAGVSDPGPDSTETPVRIEWSRPRSSLTRFGTSLSSSRDGRRHLRRAVNGFVRAQGGAKSSSRSAVQGRASTRRLGGILAAFGGRGAATAIRQAGLQNLVGRDVDALLAGLVEYVAPDGALLEDAAARDATIATLDQLFTDLDVWDQGVEALQAVDADGVRSTLERFIENYVYSRVIQTLSANAEKQSTDVLLQLEREVRSYLHEAIKLDLTNVDVFAIDWSATTAETMIESWYEDAFEIASTYDDED